MSFSEQANKYIRTFTKGTKVYVEAGFEMREAEAGADPSTYQGQRQIFLRHGKCVSLVMYLDIELGAQKPYVLSRSRNQRAQNPLRVLKLIIPPVTETLRAVSKTRIICLLRVPRVARRANVHARIHFLLMDEEAIPKFLC